MTESQKFATAKGLIPPSFPKPTKTYEGENVVHIYFGENKSIRFYFHVSGNGKLDEIQTVDCDETEFAHEKVTHRYRSVKPVS